MTPEAFFERCIDLCAHQPARFKELLGKTLLAITNLDNERLFFGTDRGETYLLFHDQECCESVSIEDICGDLNDLLGEPLLLAEEVTEDGDDPASQHRCKDYESCTWTFYKLSTRKGGVTIRWYGSSNGYYSEAVEFCKLLS